MPVTINQHELSDDEVNAEMAFHQKAANPWQAAVNALIVRQLMLDRARAIGMMGEHVAAGGRDAEEQLFEMLLNQEIQVETPDEAACLKVYQEHQDAFRVGSMAAASHILFQVTEDVPLEALRATALEILEQVRAHPDSFAEVAQRYSNCPSSEVGGQLGQLSRGDTVPEFEAVVFNGAVGEVHPELVETRFGFHIILVHQRDQGKLLPFEQVRNHIEKSLREVNWQHAVQDYLKMLTANATITGIDLPQGMASATH